MRELCTLNMHRLLFIVPFLNLKTLPLNDYNKILASVYTYIYPAFVKTK
nr:MAG TPA: hypothetical protein [Caudoviricetes sp.]